MTSLALAVPLTVVSVLGLLLNIYILFVVLVTKQVQTANNLLLLHLGAVDSLLCVTFLVFSAPEMLKLWPWLALGGPCNLHGFLFTLLHPVALWTVCGLNCDRYYAITSPLHYGSVVNSKKVAIGLGFTWLVAFILCIPPLFLVAPYRFKPDLGGCAPDFAEKEGAIWYSLTYTTFTLLLPAVLILGCNLRVLMIARYHRHRIASAIFEVTISAQVTITHQRNPFLITSGNVFRGRSAVSTVLQLIGSFLILYFPYYGVILWESSSSLFIGEWKPGSTRFHTSLVIIASTLLNCSPPVNGLLYGVKSKVLRKIFQNYWRKQMSKSEVNQEIQARTPSTCGSRRPSVTPLGFLARPASSHFHRRSSEVYLERQNSSKAAIQRITGELTWRPQSTTGINLDSTEPFESRLPAKHSSCNLLQVPKEKGFSHASHGDNLLPSYKLFQLAMLNKLPDPRESPASYKTESTNIVESESSPRKSPKILISRAYSEESDQSVVRAKESLNRSSSTNLGEKKWKRLRYEDEDEGGRKARENKENESTSASTSEEESGSGGLYLSFIGDLPEAPPAHPNHVSKDRKCKNGPLYQLSWPMRRKSNFSCTSSSVTLAKSVTDLSGVTEYQL